MKKPVYIAILMLFLIPLVAAQEFMFLDIGGTYEVYWQWFDLAIYIILFTSLAYYVFVEKMHMHKGISVGIGLALGLSMLMLEVYAGYRLILLSPYAALVIALFLWVLLWMTANAAEMGLGGKDKAELSWLWGILTFIFAMTMLSAMLRAASVNGLILGPLQSLLDFLTTGFVTGLLNILFFILLLYGLVNLATGVFPRVTSALRRPSATAPQAQIAPAGPEAARHDIDTLRDEVRRMSDSLRTDASVRLGELRTRTGQLESDIRSLIERITVLQDFLNTFRANLNEIAITCTALANEIPRLGKITDRYKNWLLGAFRSVRDSKESARKALDALQAHINVSKSDFSEFRKRFDNVATVISDIRKRLDTAGKPILEGKLSPDTVARLKPEYEEMKIRVYELERLQRDLLTQVAKVEDAQKGIETQQPLVTQAKDLLIGLLDKIEDAIENKIVTFESQIDLASNGLKEAANAAQASTQAVANLENALRILGMHARRPDESIAEMKLDEERAEHEVNDFVARLAAFEGELSKEEKTIIEEEITPAPVPDAVNTMKEVLKSLDGLAKRLKDLVTLNARHINKISKWKQPKDVQEAMNEFKLMLNVVKNEITKSKGELEISIAENEKIVMSSPTQRKVFADLVAEEIKIVKLEKEIDALVKTYVSDLDKRIAELKLQPKAISQLQREMRDVFMSIQGALENCLAKIAERQASLRKEWRI